MKKSGWGDVPQVEDEVRAALEPSDLSIAVPGLGTMSGRTMKVQARGTAGIREQAQALQARGEPHMVVQATLLVALADVLDVVNSDMAQLRGMSDDEIRAQPPQVLHQAYTGHITTITAAVAMAGTVAANIIAAGSLDNRDTLVGVLRDTLSESLRLADIAHRAEEQQDAKDKE